MDECSSESKTRVFAAVAEMLSLFAGQQIRNTAVSDHYFFNYY